MELTLAKAMFSAMIMESILYGLALATFFRTMGVLLVGGKHRRNNGKIHWPFVFVAVMMIVTGTLDVAVHFKMNMDGLISYTGGGGPDVALAQISNWVNPAHVRTLL
jgi:hypothetical protein